MYVDNLLSSAMHVHFTAFPYERFNLSVHRAKTLTRPLSQSDHNSQSLLITAGRFSCVSSFLSTVELFIHRFVLDSLTPQKQMQLCLFYNYLQNQL